MTWDSREKFIYNNHVGGFKILLILLNPQATFIHSYGHS